MAVRMSKVNKMRSLAVVTAGASLLFTGVCISKGNHKFYNQVVMPIVQLLPPETSHNLAVKACKYKLFSQSSQADPANLTTRFFNRDISNPIGIAAGFDKQGEAVVGLQQIGFGIVEIGSVTPEPQPGNPEPRVFRLPNDNAIINRYGFNSEGHKVVYERLKELRKSGEFKGVLGVNLGKNKATETAVNDYVQGVHLFGPIADYLVVNVSSPNTPGLRNLQGKKELENLLQGIITARNNLPYNNTIPVFLKLSPDLSKDDVKDVITVISKKASKVDGLIVANTTVSRENLKEVDVARETGGLSGSPLKSRSTELIAEIFKQTKGSIPIIGVGGISSGADAFEKLEAGASYIQFYTALIYHGPPIVSRIKSELSDIIHDKGYNSVSEVVGTNFKKYLSA